MKTYFLLFKWGVTRGGNVQPPGLSCRAWIEQNLKYKFTFQAKGTILIKDKFVKDRYKSKVTPLELG